MFRHDHIEWIASHTVHVCAPHQHYTALAMLKQAHRGAFVISSIKQWWQTPSRYLPLRRDAGQNAGLQVRLRPATRVTKHEEVRVGHTPEPLSGKPSKVGTTATLHKQDSTAHEKKSVHRVATPASSSTRVVHTSFFQSGASQPEMTDNSGRKSPLPCLELKTKANLERSY